MTSQRQILNDINCEYNKPAFTHSVADKTIKIIYDNPHKSQDGTRWRSNENYTSGMFSARIKCPRGDTTGLVSAFYLSSQVYVEGEDDVKDEDRDHDEIDIEFVGNNHSQVQTNYYVNGDCGDGANEETFDLAFDTSRDFHEYAINWQHDKIEWFVDGKILRVLEKSKVPNFPKQSMYLYGCIWKGEKNHEEWCGAYKEGPDKPYICVMKDVHVATP